MKLNEDGGVGGETLLAPPSEQKAKLKGIAICGSHPKTKMLAPFNDDWLIYACSPDNSPHGSKEGGACALPRVDEWFEVHVPVFDRSRPYAYLIWLQTQKRVWMRDTAAMQLRGPDGNPVFPTAVEYPAEAMKLRFGWACWTSSIAFMIAKAIVDCEEQGIPALGLWGILQASQTEYTKQRQGTQQMLWEAQKVGLNVFVAEESRLFHTPPEDF